MTEHSLNGEWQMKQQGSGIWQPAAVPGCNYSDLLAAGKISDPFAEDNELKDFWVSEVNWEYRRTFTADEAMLAADVTVLRCEQLDTICEVFINGELVGKGENNNRIYEFPIKEYLKAGENEIYILFYSPVQYGAKLNQNDDMPKTANTDADGVPHVRKTQCHFGWDWGPKIPISGITRDISVRSYEMARIADMKVTQIHNEGTVDVTVACASKEFRDGNYRFKVALEHPDGEKEAIEVPAREGKVVFHIEKPELWWTKELSGKEKQPLYKAEVQLISGRKILDKTALRIGLRTVELYREKDQWGKNFQFRLNGVPIFAKGANWIPADSFINRFTPEKIDYFIHAAQKSNMNMLRVWGGGYFETDYFYDKCDECGILIWQDFLFACDPYPFYNEPFLENVKAEIKDNVCRLRHHACLALWCGNNEIETMSQLWKSYHKLTEWTEKFFYHILPEELRKHDDVTPFIEGSPVGDGYMNKYDDDNYGDTHLWQVWHGLKPLTYYRKRHTRFCSEFGLESFPDLLTLTEYIDKKNWALDSDVMMVHQKCRNGNNKMLYYMASRFRIMKSFEDLVTLTQIIQSEGVRDAAEHWRRNRGRCNGSIWWQFNDCWPTSSWAGVDYRGRYKVLQYAAKHFFAPVMVSLEDSKNKIRIHLINDLTAPFKGSLRWRAVRFDGQTIYGESVAHVTIPPLTANCKAEINLPVFLKEKDRKDSFFVAELLDENKRPVSRKVILFAKENKVSFPRPSIQTKVDVKDGFAEIELLSKQFAHFVSVRAGQGVQPFSDNFFDLLPGEKKIITVPVTEGMTREAFSKTLKVRSIADMEPAGTIASDTAARFKILCGLGCEACKNAISL